MESTVITLDSWRIRLLGFTVSSTFEDFFLKFVLEFQFVFTIFSFTSCRRYCICLQITVNYRNNGFLLQIFDKKALVRCCSFLFPCWTFQSLKNPFPSYHMKHKGFAKFAISKKTSISHSSLQPSVAWANFLQN